MNVNSFNKPLLLICVFLLWKVPVQAQQLQYALPGPVVPEYGRLSDTDFNLVPADTVLHDFRYLYNGMEVRFEVNDNRIHALITRHFRIRIQTLAGTMAAYVTIPLYAENDLETLENVRGRTWKSTQEFVNLDTTARRIVNVNERYAISEYTMPDVTIGSVLEYSYTIRRRYLEELPDFHLAMQQPVDLAMVRIVNSTFVRYKATPVNVDERVRMYEARVDTSAAVSIFKKRPSEPLLVQAWHASDIPALKAEPLSGDLDDYRARIKFQWSEFGNPRQFLEQGWDVVAAELRRRGGLESNIIRYKKANEIGQDFTRRFPNRQERILQIYEHVRDTATPSVNRGITDTENPAIVLEGKPASHALVNQALIGILRGAGIEAWPLLTATRDAGKILLDFPSYYQFNRLLVAVPNGNEVMVLDASDRFSEPGMLPEDVAPGDAFLITGTSHRWINLDPSQNTSRLQVSLRGRLAADGSLSAHIETHHEGIKSRQFLQRQFRLPDADLLAEEFLFGNTGRVKYHRAQTRGSVPGDTVGLKLDIEIPHYGISFAEGVEFLPLLVGWITENPLGDGPRQLPVNLDQAEMFTFTAELEVPPGLQMPEPADEQELRFPGAKLFVGYRQEGNVLRYRIDIQLDALRVQPENIREIRDFYENWKVLSNARWFLEKKGRS